MGTHTYKQVHKMKLRSGNTTDSNRSEVDNHDEADRSEEPPVWHTGLIVLFTIYVAYHYLCTQDGPPAVKPPREYSHAHLSEWKREKQNYEFVKSIIGTMVTLIEHAVAFGFR